MANLVNKGGITPLNKLIRSSLKYKILLGLSKKRDNYTCNICKTTKGRFHTDHYPKSFSQIIKENSIKSMEEALNCPEMWDINNLRTLCESCHYFITFGKLMPNNTNPTILWGKYLRKEVD